jgi:hypothetical protein
LLPEDGLEAIEKAMSNPSVSGGSFFMKFDEEKCIFNFYSSFTKLNSSYFTYGDQGIFIRRNIFTAMGGYKDLPIMEDVEIQKRVRKRGKFVKLPLAVTTSAKRFAQHGKFKQQLLNIFLLSAYKLGVSPSWIKKFYSDIR